MMLSASLPRLGELYDWWRGEMTTVLRSGALSRLLAPTDVLRLYWTNDQFKAIRVHRGAERERFRCARAEVPHARNLLEAVGMLDIAGQPVHCPVILRIDHGVALGRSLNLPGAAAANLREILSWEIDRLTPFTADDVHFGCRILANDQLARTVCVQFAFVPRALVDRMLAELLDLGVRVDAIEVAWETGAPEPFWSIPVAGREDHTQRRKRAARRVAVGLASAAVMLSLANIAIPFYRQHQQLRLLEEQIAVFRPQAEAVLRMQHTLSQMGAGTEIVLQSRSAAPSVLRVLDELTRLAPDDTWLEKLRYANAEIEAAGHSTAASSLVSLIESSPIFIQTRFVAPVTRDPNSDADSFRIAFRVIPEALP